MFIGMSLGATVGSIRKKPSGNWEARYRDTYGRPRGKSFNTKREAQMYLQRVGADMQRGDWLDPRIARTTFAQWAEAWMATKVNLRGGTRVGYGSILETHVLPDFGTIAVGRIDKLMIKGWIAHKVATGVGPGTIRNAFGVLRQVLGGAVDGGALRINPCDGIDLPRVAREEMHFATHDQIATLANAIAHPEDEKGRRKGTFERYGLLVLLDAYTGLRFGEIAALRRKRIDIVNKRIDVTESVREVSGRLEYSATKTYETRSAPLPQFLVDSLADLLTKIPEDPEAFVFTSPDGEPLRNGNFRARHFKRAVSLAGLPDGFRIHDLRHTFAAFLVAEGAHPLAVTKRLGHSSIQVTHDRYGHLFPHLEADLTAALDAAGRAARMVHSN
ncbi:MAG: site-specific integrase [Acidimicrobiales bacterium]|nr:site-specific integrase [Acidimicrobiales bacterium]